MIILDFFIFYLSHWFSQRAPNSWSSPVETACYLLGLMTAALLYSVSMILQFQLPQLLPFQFSKLSFLIAGLFVIGIYTYVYSYRKRYETVKETIPEIFKISNDTGALICIAIAVIATMSPFLIIMIFTPFGGGGHH